MAVEEHYVQQQVVGGEVRTGIFLEPTDQFKIFADGIVDFGGAVLGFGAPKNDPDAYNEPENAPLGYPAPQCRKNSLIWRIDTGQRGVMGLPQQAFAADWRQGGRETDWVPVTVRGELVLRTNDKDITDNSQGWRARVQVQRGVRPPEPPNVTDVVGDVVEDVGDRADGDGARPGVPNVPQL